MPRPTTTLSLPTKEGGRYVRETGDAFWAVTCNAARCSEASSPLGRASATRDGVSRFLLLLVIVLSAIKMTELLGVEEHTNVRSRTPIDLVFKSVVLACSAIPALIALAKGRIRAKSLMFLPFLAWATAVAIVNRSSLEADKQIASYATWIFFFVGACSVFGRPGDHIRARRAVVASVVVSMLGGVVQYLQGLAPMVGLPWPSTMSFIQIHTGSGGILLDCFAPFTATFLFISESGATSWRAHLRGWGMWLVGAVDVLRGGVAGFALGFSWLLWASPRKRRNRLVPIAVLALALAFIAVGDQFTSKTFTSGTSLNTSGRMEHWPLLVGWAFERPILGWGPNADIQLLAFSSGRDLFAAHNEILSTAVNYGFVGMLLLWGPLLGLLWTLMRRAARDRGQDKAVCSAAAVLVMLLVVSVTDNTLRTPGVMILALAPAAVADGTRRAHRRSSPAMRANSPS